MCRTKGPRPLLYFAAPLFSEAELSYNVEVASILERHVDVYLPQRDGGRVVDLVSKGVGQEAGCQIHSAGDVDCKG